MAKQVGLGDNFYLDNYNVSGDVGSIESISGGPTPEDMTGIDKFAFERQGTLRDGSMKWRSFFNPAVGASHEKFAQIPTVDVMASYFRGTAIGNPAASMIAKQSTYAATRGVDASLAFDVEALGNGYGLEWGLQLTPGVRTDTVATNGTGLDNGASTAFGLQAYLHVFAFAGTSVIVKLQDSPDNAAWSDVANGTFGAIAAAGSGIRIATPNNQSVARWLRVITGAGTFTSIAYAVNVVRNATAGMAF